MGHTPLKPTKTRQKVVAQEMSMTAQLEEKLGGLKLYAHIGGQAGGR